MSVEKNELNWDVIMSKFSSYEGTILNFCKENNISSHQLYYRRKRIKNSNLTTFCELPMDPPSIDNSKNCHSNITTDITIEIKNIKIHIPSSEATLLATIIRELADLC